MEATPIHTTRGVARMTAKVRLICGPAGSGKTALLRSRYRDAAQASIGTALWLGPTRRAVEAVRAQMASGVLLAPQMLTFQDFADVVVHANDPDAQPLSDAQRRLLVDDIVADLHQRGELSHFHRVAETRGFAEGVVALLAELKRNEIWPADFARTTYRRVRGHAISAKERQCIRIYAQYQQQLVRHNLYDVEGRVGYARDLLRRGRRRPFEAVRAVFVDGFSDFTRTQCDILTTLGDIAEELWITLPDEADDARAELFTRARAIKAQIAVLLKDGCHAFAAQSRLVLSPSTSQGRESMPTPFGLTHLERQLFRPLRAVEKADDAAGIECIAAPGPLGEVRLVARRVKTLLLGGTPAADILLTARDLLPYADLVREVFAEYGIPLDVEGTEPAARNPAVAMLLRALRLPDEDWPFAGVTALLRSGFFRPDWPETRVDPDVAQHAEVLLRLIGEPRGRGAYLEAVRRWAERPLPGLEDEQAEESRRLKTHELAKRCQAFLQHFFRAWDDEPEQANLADCAAWLQRIADDLGLTRAALESPRETEALRRLYDELQHWVGTEARLNAGGRPHRRKEFRRVLLTLAAAVGLARTPRGPGRVRFLSAELARNLDVPYLFVLGLGERSFPRLAVSQPLFDEQERQTFKQAGLDFLCLSDLLPDEMLLFYQVVTRARRQLVLSYPAVDDKGQALLASSFLDAVFECFTPDAIPVERRNMLIEGYDRDAPLSPAEQRVRAATQFATGEGTLNDLSLDLAENLSAAATAARHRFFSKEYSPYDGLLRHPGVVADVQRLFAPEKVFSPTALEEYVACPYRFFLRHVLRLQPLEEPREEIEHTRRGQACHRALSRLHEQLQADGVHGPVAEVDARVLARMAEAVEEYVARAPSPASKMLWRLEGERLQKAAARYRGHWQQFLAPWAAEGVVPRPHRFEVEFGLPDNPLILTADGIEVRVSGRIDRVDVAELPDGLGFWVIDYKTGRPQHYTGTDLREYRRLQLTLYALAVERVLLADQPARPLGLAYWMVVDKGPKPALPGTRNPTSWLTGGDWPAVRAALEHWVVELAANIRTGVFPLKPRTADCTATCDFAEVCRISQSRVAVEAKEWQLSLPVVSS